jgi:hypothetical protein
MALSDYAVARDKFEAEEIPSIELSFPCCACKFSVLEATRYPCNNCDHNANTQKEGDK